MSLGAIWYRSAVNERTGPIARLETIRLPGADGRDKWNAYAFLSPAVADISALGGNSIYGDAAGTGTGKSRHEACHKAISEAMERWAWLVVTKDKSLAASVRLGLDASTSGFAAWPGPWARPARRRARLEALERWAVAAWWDGLIGHTRVDHPTWTILRLVMPGAAARSPVVIVLAGQGPRGLCVYGFAADDTEAAAIRRASIELARNVRMLGRWLEGPGLEPTLLLERRLLFFARPEGAKLFRERATHPMRDRASAVAAPALAVDTPVPGPWDRYCRVWRSLFAPADATASRLCGDDDRLDRFKF
jgi:hypothetical protein